MHAITVVVDLVALGPNGRADPSPTTESWLLPLEVTKVMYLYSTIVLHDSGAFRYAIFQSDTDRMVPRPWNAYGRLRWPNGPFYLQERN
jgi:hypothetical protein